MPGAAALVGIDANLGVPEIMEHTAEGLALDHDLVGLVRKIADDLLLPEGVLRIGVLQKDQIHK